MLFRLRPLQPGAESICMMSPSTLPKPPCCRCTPRYASSTPSSSAPSAGSRPSGLLYSRRSRRSSFRLGCSSSDCDHTPMSWPSVQDRWDLMACKHNRVCPASSSTISMPFERRLCCACNLNAEEREALWCAATHGTAELLQTWRSRPQKWTSGLSLAVLCSSAHACSSRPEYATCRTQQSNVANSHHRI